MVVTENVAVLAPVLQAVKFTGLVAIAAVLTVKVAAELVTEAQAAAPETTTRYR